MKQLKTLLGIVFYEQTISVAEVSFVEGSVTVSKAAEYTLSKTVTIENVSSDAVGFKTFLKENGFKAKEAVVGLSAKHMITTLLKMPPIKDAQVRHDTIKINLERKMEVDFSEVVYDYDDHGQSGKDGVLIMMFLKKMLAEVKELLKAAKMTPLKITNTSLGLDLQTQPAVTCNIVEFPASFELCLLNHGCLHAVRHVSKTAQQTDPAEFARKITRQVNRLCLTSGLAGDVQYCIWSPDTELYSTNQQVQQLLAAPEYKTLRSSSNHPLCDMAAELAAQTLIHPTDWINFLNGRHEEKKPSLAKKWCGKAVALAVAILVLIGIFVFNWNSDMRQIADYQQQLDDMKDNVQTAEKMIDQVGYARQWFQQEPQYLEILRELTLSFPQNSDIWITSLAVDESLHQILTGRTVSEDAVLDVVETLQSKQVFDDIKILYIRKMGKGTDLMTFAINLQYRKGL